MKTWRRIALNRYRYTVLRQYTGTGMLYPILIPVSVMLRLWVSYYTRILYILYMYFR
jgi:hypothetical protein